MTAPRDLLRTVPWRALILTFAIGLVPVAIVVVVLNVTDLNEDSLIADALEWLDQPWYVGALSALGSLLWAVGVGACVACGVATRRLAAPRWSSFLLWLAAATALLALDDTYRFHDGALPGLGIPEEVTIVVVVLPALVVLWVFRDLIGRSDGRWFLLAAAGFFAASLFLDVTKTYRFGLGLAEDCLKFLGIVGWTAGLIRMSVDAVTLDRRPDPDGARQRA